MRDMNADRASMMKNRPLRNREDEDRECARALDQRSRDAQCKFRDARNDGRTGTAWSLRKTPLQSPHCSHRSSPLSLSKRYSLIHSPEHQSVVFSAPLIPSHWQASC